jgi:uncharacterized protein with von Willebrand factor type A (vWA) domain
MGAGTHPERLPRLLHDAGLACGPEMTRDFLQALATIRFSRPSELYWIARTVLLKSPEAQSRFDRVFEAWLAGREEALLPASGEIESEDEQRVEGQSAKVSAAVNVEAGEGGGSEAAGLDAAGTRRVDRSGAAIRERIAAIAEGARKAMPRRRAIRRVKARRGHVDVERTLKQDRDFAGEFKPPLRLERPERARRLTLLVDVSGSMKAASLDALRVAHGLMRTLPRTEVFTFGTRLTRATRLLARADLDRGLGRLAEALFDWDGGTRIGSSLATFLSRPHFAALVRGAVVVIVSDGFERGDPAAMVRAVERLARLSHRLIWASPMMADPRYRPETRAMKAIMPAVDRMSNAASLEAWSRFPAALAAAEAAPRGLARRQFSKGGPL